VLLPVIAALGALGFVLAVVSAHCLRTDLAAGEATLSIYFSGRTRVLMFVAYFALALALLAVSALLVNARPSFPRVFTAMLCLLATLCLIPIAFTARRDLSLPDTRTPFALRLHRWAALLALLAMVLGQPGPYHGALQKTLVSALVLWIWLVSLSEGMAYR
jgi:hypothetical protein